MVPNETTANKVDDVARHVPDERAIEKHTRELLKRAGTHGRFPTPVDDIVAAAGLDVPKKSLLSRLAIDEAPPHLKRALRKVTGRVRAVLDRREREIHVDPTISNQGRAAFIKLHEVGHDIYPWQRALGYADDDATFLPSIKNLFEQEANIGASNLLFQHEHFDDLVREYAIGQASILDLAGIVGASGHATFRRFITVHNGVVAGVVMDLSPCSRDPLAYRRHEVVASPAWSEQFGTGFWPTVLRAEPYVFVNVAETARLTSEAVLTECSLPDLRNEMVPLQAEVYTNQHVMFVLIWKARRETLRRRRLIVPTTAAS